jgi:hypothetical protein
VRLSIGHFFRWCREWWSGESLPLTTLGLTYLFDFQSSLQILDCFGDVIAGRSDVVACRAGQLRLHRLQLLDGLSQLGIGNCLRLVIAFLTRRGLVRLFGRRLDAFQGMNRVGDLVHGFHAIALVIVIGTVQQRADRLKLRNGLAIWISPACRRQSCLAIGR